MSVLIKNKNLTDAGSLPTTFGELEHIIEKCHRWNICAGGPSSAFAPSVVTDAAYRDGATWRHRDCDIILEKGPSCLKCCSIDHTLARSIDRSVSLKFRIGMLAKVTKGRNIVQKQKELEQLGTNRLKSTPRSKQKILLQNKLVRSLQASLNRRDKKIKDLEDSFVQVGQKNCESVFQKLMQKTNTDKIPDERVNPYFIL